MIVHKNTPELLGGIFLQNNFFSKVNKKIKMEYFEASSETNYKKEEVYFIVSSNHSRTIAYPVLMDFLEFSK